MKHAGGRPTEYKPSYNKQAEKLCLLGATDKEMAEFFEISEATLNTWKKSHPEFLDSIKEGRSVADSNVAKSLYQRALGFQHKAIEILVINKKVKKVPYIKIYPPEPVAAIFWLKNRRKQDWRDKQDVEHSGKIQWGEEPPK